MAERIGKLGVNMRPDYEIDSFSLTSSFCYTDPSQMVSGVSLGSLPLVLTLKTSAAPANSTIQSFSECGINLVIDSSGYMRLEDAKDPTDFGMY
jgi:hypothetical protein